MCNILSDAGKVRDFALAHKFSGIDWSFELDRLPETPLQESRWAKDQAMLAPLEVRYHCPFYRIDLGHVNPALAEKAEAIFRRIIHLVSKVGGRYLSIHIGLGHDSTEPLSWETSIDNLRRLVQFGTERRIKVCLENLAWGWTSKPNIFEKLVRLSGAGVTLDIGHAYVSESVETQQYTVEDFITPHEGRVFNAHIYHTEIPGRGHIPPKRIEDIEDRLALLREIDCRWWVIEIKKPEGLLKTREIIDQYLTRADNSHLKVEALSSRTALP